MTRLSSLAVVVAVLTAAVVLLAPAPASACPSCDYHYLWTATPCRTGNCSPCGFCAYCCDRFGIGCQYCEIFRTPPEADGAGAGCTAEAAATPARAEDPVEALLREAATSAAAAE